MDLCLPVGWVFGFGGYDSGFLEVLHVWVCIVAGVYLGLLSFRVI